MHLKVVMQLHLPRLDSHLQGWLSQCMHRPRLQLAGLGQHTWMPLLLNAVDAGSGSAGSMIPESRAPSVCPQEGRDDAQVPG
jgi:hypothetical protein